MFVEFTNLINGSEAGLLLRLGGLALGVLLLIKGQSILRFAVVTLLFLTGALAGCLAFRCFAIDGWVPAEPWVVFVLSLLAGCLIAATSRMPMISRWAEVILTVVLALWLLPLLREYFRPEVSWTIVCLLIAASIACRPMLIGVLAAVAFAIAIGPSMWSTGLLLLISAVCLCTSWMRFGRLPAETISARGDTQSGAFGLLSVKSDKVRVIAAFDDDDEMKYWVNKCERRGHHVRALEGFQRIVEAELPRYIAAASQRMPSLMSLAAVTPAVIDLAQRRCSHHEPVVQTAAATTITLDEIKDRHRTGKDRQPLQGPGTNGEKVRVAIIDTGAEKRSEYAHRIVDSTSVVEDEPDVDDHSESRHGSNTAMIVATLAPEVLLLIVKAFCTEGYSQLIWILDAIAWAIEHGADVINASWGGCHCKGANHCVLCRAVNGIQPVVCASAGNEGPTGKTLACPGAARSAIATASADRIGKISRFSSRGPSADVTNPKPDLTAIGEGVLLRTTARGENNTPMNGTSFSAPQVTAAAACVISAAGLGGTKPDKTYVKNVLLRSARPGDLAIAGSDPHAAGAGMLNIADAVTSVRQCRQPTTRWPPEFSRRLLPAAVIVVLVGGFCWCSLDHNNCLLRMTDQTIQNIGWVRADAQGALLLDDGTGTVPVTWSDRDTAPTPGSLVYIRGQWCSQKQRVQGRSRITLLAGTLSSN